MLTATEAAATPTSAHRAHRECPENPPICSTATPHWHIISETVRKLGFEVGFRVVMGGIGLQLGDEPRASESVECAFGAVPGVHWGYTRVAVPAEA